MRLFLVGYESGNDEILTRIKKGVTMDEMRKLHQVLPPGRRGHSRHVHSRSARRDAGNDREHDPFRQGTGRVQHPGFPRRALSRHGALRNGPPKRLVHEEGQDRPRGDDGFQQSALEYPGLSKDEIFEEVDRFYRAYYLRPKPILRIIKTMLEDKDVCVRRCREGYEFFSTLNQRKKDLAAAKAVAA